MIPGQVSEYLIDRLHNQHNKVFHKLLPRVYMRGRFADSYLSVMLISSVMNSQHPGIRIPTSAIFFNLLIKFVLLRSIYKKISSGGFVVVNNKQPLLGPIVHIIISEEYVEIACECIVITVDIPRGKKRKTNLLVNPCDLEPSDSRWFLNFCKLISDIQKKLR